MPVEKRKSNTKKHHDVKGKKKVNGQGKDEGAGDAVTANNSESRDAVSASSRSTGRRLLLRLSTIAALLLGAHFYLGTKDPFTPMARQTDNHPAKFVHIRCSDDFREDRKKFTDCAPMRCGRSIMDNIVSEGEATQLLEVAKRGLAFGGSNGGASILDLHSGALSKGDSFINIYKYLEDKNVGDVFSTEDIQLYRKVADKIKVAISARFQIPQQKLYLTHPTFFSQLTSRPPKTVHDEYWHVHVDKQTYETFDYTSLLYLTDYGIDFDGGRFVFTDSVGNWTVEPKLGRLSFFTSGSENPHYVEKVTRGTRYAITVSFTCDRKHAIKYPSMGS